MRVLVGAALCLAFAVSGTSARAGLFGHDITAAWEFPEAGTEIESHLVTVGPEIELTGDVIVRDSDFSIDLRDRLIVFTSNHDGHFQDTPVNGWRFTDAAGDIPDFAGFEIAYASAGVAGLDPEDLSFDANSVFVNLGDSGPTGEHVTWQFFDQFALRVHFVPEPASAALVVLSAAALAIPGYRVGKRSR